MTEADQLEARLRAAEAIWAQGPRSFAGSGLQVGVKQGEGVHHKGQKLPVSMSLPDDNRAGVPDRLYGHEVRRHDDGTFSTVDRRPICHNADAMKKHTERIGWTHERS